MHHREGHMKATPLIPHRPCRPLVSILTLVLLGFSVQTPATAQTLEPKAVPAIPSPKDLPRLKKKDIEVPGIRPGAAEGGAEGTDGDDAEPTPALKPSASDESSKDESDDGDDSAASEEDEASAEDGASSIISPPRQKPPILDPNAKIMLDFVNKPIMDLIKYMAEITGRNFILTDDIKGEITIISHKPVSVPAAYEAFLSALEQTGYTTVTVGNITKVVSSGDAKKNPIRIHQNGNIPFTDNYVTQVIELENVSVNDISSVVKELMSKDASVISYAPANTLILTDAATNIRKIYRIINQLDIAAPKSKLSVISLQHSTAADIQKIIQDLYGASGSASSTGSTGVQR